MTQSSAVLAAAGTPGQTVIFPTVGSNATFLKAGFRVLLYDLAGWHRT